MISKRTFVKTTAYSAAGLCLGKSLPLLAQETDAQRGEKFKNPLIDQPGMSDPHILVENDVCYAFTGHDVGFGTPGWVMPDWRIFRSTDLQIWEQVGTISPADNYMGKGNTNCWAGHFAKRNGQYYWYFSNHNKSIGVMAASKPEGPYHDVLGKPLLDAPGSFDPTIFVEDDNKPYIIYGMGTYKIARLKESMTELDEEPKDIIVNDTKTARFPHGDKNFVHKHNGIYYLSTSGFYATSKNLFGPYEARGVVGRGWGVNSGYGHGMFFTWKGNWHHVWCRYEDRTKDKIRDCFIAPTYYDEDGSMHDDLSQMPEKYK